MNKPKNSQHSPLEGWRTLSDGVEKALFRRSLFPYWNLPKNKSLSQKAKDLRKQGILAEVIFWRNCKRSLNGWDLDRQIIIGNFIVDFFIPEIGLVIEIDGSTHNHKGEYDIVREHFLLSLDLHVIHYRDSDVINNFDGVYNDLIRTINERVEDLTRMLPPRPADTPQEGTRRNFNQPRDKFLF